jgi:flagellar biogenesis protein FliO
VKREQDLRSGAVKFMTTETLRVSASAFRARVIAFCEHVLRLRGRARKRLRLCESLPLGERRFVAVVEFDAARFLVGGTPSSLVLLSRLSDTGDGSEDAIGGEIEDASGMAAPAGKKRQGEKC